MAAQGLAKRDAQPIEEFLSDRKLGALSQRMIDAGVHNVGTLKLLRKSDLTVIGFKLGAQGQIWDLILELSGAKSSAAAAGGSSGRPAPAVVQKSTGWGSQPTGDDTFGDGGEGRAMAWGEMGNDAPYEPKYFILKMKGLPFKVRPDEIKAFFQWSSIEIVHRSFVMEKNEEGRSTGVGFVILSTREDLDKAMAELNGQELETNDGQKRTCRLYKSNKGEYMRAGGSDPEGELGGGGTDGWPIKLRGMPFRATFDEVAEFFRWADPTIEIIPGSTVFEKNAEMKKTGVGYVLVNSREEVDRAVEQLDKQPLTTGGRYVFVNRGRMSDYKAAKNPDFAAMEGDAQEVSIKCKQRQEARKARDFDKADEIRNELQAQGYRLDEGAMSWTGPGNTSGRWGPKTPLSLDEAAGAADVPAAGAAAAPADEGAWGNTDAQWGSTGAWPSA
eukprot:TRINITY_DN2416_c1_g1_i1.p2 TRINITY_DN2416_c1_g1~~TRINITY_DN2416_c1_g1_i1.p2  ORF type:complete len:444 (+),score=178.99 TRINITY_DN2416_c1_g1_i1:95-1426(+)